jgi:uncharacterized protein
MEPSSSKRYLLIGGLVILGILLYFWWSSPLIVTVTGMGEIKVPATEATVSFTLADNDPSPVVAVTKLKARAEEMRKLLNQNGVVDAEIVQAQPRVIPAALVSQGGSGYTATMSMGGKTTQVNQISQLSAALYERGATLVSQPVLSVTDMDKFENQAFQKALSDAKGKATQMALKNFKFIKKMAAISQTDASSGTVTSRGEVASTGLSAQVGQMPGDTLTVSKVVEVTYRMW